MPEYGTRTEGHKTVYLTLKPVPPKKKYLVIGVVNRERPRKLTIRLYQTPWSEPTMGNVVSYSPSPPGRTFKTLPDALWALKIAYEHSIKEVPSNEPTQ